MGEEGNVVHANGEANVGNATEEGHDPLEGKLRAFAQEPTWGTREQSTRQDKFIAELYQREGKIAESIRQIEDDHRAEATQKINDLEAKFLKIGTTIDEHVNALAPRVEKVKQKEQDNQRTITGMLAATASKRKQLADDDKRDLQDVAQELKGRKSEWKSSITEKKRAIPQILKGIVDAVRNSQSQNKNRVRGIRDQFKSAKSKLKAIVRGTEKILDKHLQEAELASQNFWPLADTLNNIVDESLPEEVAGLHETLQQRVNDAAKSREHALESLEEAIETENEAMETKTAQEVEKMEENVEDMQNSQEKQMRKELEIARRSWQSGRRGMLKEKEGLQRDATKLMTSTDKKSSVRQRLQEKLSGKVDGQMSAEDALPAKLGDAVDKAMLHGESLLADLASNRQMEMARVKRIVAELMTTKKTELSAAAEQLVTGATRNSMKELANEVSGAARRILPEAKTLDSNYGKAETLEGKADAAVGQVRDLHKKQRSMEKSMVMGFTKLRRNIFRTDEDIKKQTRRLAKMSTKKMKTTRKNLAKVTSALESKLRKTTEGVKKEFEDMLRAEELNVLDSIGKVKKELNELHNVVMGSTKLERYVDKVERREAQGIAKAVDAISLAWTQSVDRADRAISNSEEMTQKAFDNADYKRDRVMENLRKSVEESFGALKSKYEPIMERNEESLERDEANWERSIQAQTQKSEILETKASGTMTQAEMSTRTAQERLRSRESEYNQKLEELQSEQDREEEAIGKKVRGASEKVKSEMKNVTSTLAIAVEKIKGKKDSDVEGQTDVGQKGINQLKNRGEDFKDSYMSQVDRVASAIDKRSNELHLDEIEALRADVETTRAQNKAMLSTDQQKLQQAMDQYTMGTMGRVKELKDKAGGQIGQARAEGINDINSKSGKYNVAIGDYVSTMKGDTRAGERELDALGLAMAKSQTDIGYDISNQVRAADKLVNGQMKTLEDAEEGAQFAQKKVVKSFQTVEEDAAKLSMEFEGAMQAAARALANALGKNAVGVKQLLMDLDKLTSEINGKLKHIAKEDMAPLKEIVDDAKMMVKEVQGRVDAAEKVAKDIMLQVSGIQAKTDSVLSRGMDLDNLFRKDLTTLTDKLLKLARDEQMERTNQTSSIVLSTHDLTHTITFSLELVNRLVTKMDGQFRFDVGNLEITADSIDRRLENVLRNEKYMDENAIIDAHNKRVKSVTGLKELERWKGDVLSVTNHWRQVVQDEFRAMGHELDLTEMEIAQQQAMENWAITSQKQMLMDHLGAEITDMSAAAKARLAKLAEESGQEISRLMSDTTLTEAERARLIAAEKERAKKHAIHILESNQRLALSQDTAGRKLTVSIEDMQHTMKRIAQISEGGIPPEDIHEKLEKVKQDIQRTSNNLDISTASLVQTSEKDEELPGMGLVKMTEDAAMSYGPDDVEDYDPYDHHSNDKEDVLVKNELQDGFVESHHSITEGERLDRELNGVLEALTA